MKSKLRIIILVLVVLAGNQFTVLAADPIKDYAEAWKEKNSEARLKIIKTFWLNDSTYQDPSAHVKGIEDLNAMIEKFQKDFPGATMVGDVVLTTGNYRSFNWQILFKNRSKPLSG